jgi:hypothetical protein
VEVATCGSSFDTVLAVYRGSAVDSLGRVAANDDRCGVQSDVRFLVTAGTTYRIAVEGLGGSQGEVELELRVTSPPPNDDFAAAQDLGNGLTATVPGTTIDATTERGEPVELSGLGSVWYRWTAPAGRNIQIDTCSGDFDSVLAVYEGTALDALTPVVADDDTCDLQSQVRFDAVAGTTYAVAVGTLNAVGVLAGQQGAFDLNLEPSRNFRIVRANLNRRRGSAALVVRVPNPGNVELARTKRVRGAAVLVDQPGRVKLPIRPRGRAARLLDERGRATLRAEVTYTPDGGRPNTAIRSLTLTKR